MIKKIMDDVWDMVAGPVAVMVAIAIFVIAITFLGKLDACSKAKNDMSVDDFYAWIIRVYLFLEAN